MNLRRILGGAAAASLVPLGLAVTASTAQATVLSCNAVITSSVTLTADVGPCDTRQGLFVFGDNITLDLNGHSVIGSGKIAVSRKNENGVYVFGTHDTVKNGTVTKWNNGIFLDNSGSSDSNTFNTVTGIRAVDNIGPDASGNYGEGIQVYQGGSNVITNNQVVHNGPFSGINVYLSHDNVVRGNQVVNNNIPSDDEHHGSGPLMQDIGIWAINLVADPSKALNNTVSSNSIANNGLDGIQFARFTNSGTVVGNTSTGNGFGQTPGTVIPARSPSCADGDGIANFGNSNQIRSNNTVRNGGNGIAVYASEGQGQSNTIQANRSFLNGTTTNCKGIAFDLTDTNLSPPLCDSNTWSGNVFGTKNQACVG